MFNNARGQNSLSKARAPVDPKQARDTDGLTDRRPLSESSPIQDPIAGSRYPLVAGILEPLFAVGRSVAQDPRVNCPPLFSFTSQLGLAGPML